MRLPCAAFLVLSSFSIAQKDHGKECECFRTNGSSAGYFTNHRFFDYRNIKDALSTAPDILKTPAGNTNAPATSDYLSSSAFTDDWEIQSWNNSDTLRQPPSDATALMINSASNVYIEKSTDSSHNYESYLTLRTFRQPDFQSVAEIDSIQLNYHYLSARFLARVIGSPGACAGMFTYLSADDPQDVQEADIEILTSGPRNVVQYTNQPSNDAEGNVIPQATVNASEPLGRDWSDWVVYRMDWMPSMTSWYVDGQSAANISFQVPRDASGLVLNMWSDGGSWTGNMSVFDQAYLQVQWIEVVYNTSDPASSQSKRAYGGVSGGLELEKRKGTPRCTVVCSVDEHVNVTGTPAVLYSNVAPMGQNCQAMRSIVWINLVVLGFIY